MTDSSSQKIPGFTSTLLMPMSRPAVTMAGSSGMKMSARTLIPRCSALRFSAPAAATSALLISPISVSSRISAATFSTVPGPMMIWNCPFAANEPWTRSLADSAAWSTLPSSASANRNRVMQLVTALMFPAPPTASMMACAPSRYSPIVPTLCRPTRATVLAPNGGLSGTAVKGE